MAVTPATLFGGTFSIATDTSTTTVSIGGLVDLQTNIDVGEVDVSHTEDATRWSSFIFTRGGLTISGTVRFDPGSAEHEATLLDQLFFERNWKINWNDVTTTSDTTWTGTGFLTNVSSNGAHDDALSATFTLRVDGAPTFTGVA